MHQGDKAVVRPAHTTDFNPPKYIAYKCNAQKGLRIPYKKGPHHIDPLSIKCSKSQMEKLIKKYQARNMS